MNEFLDSAVLTLVEERESDSFEFKQQAEAVAHMIDAIWGHCTGVKKTDDDRYLVHVNTDPDWPDLWVRLRTTR